MPIETVTPTISTGAYASGDVIGGGLTFQGVLANRGILTQVSVYDADGEGVQLDFFLFNAALAGTYTDNAAFAIDSADRSKWIGVITVAASDYVSAGADKVATKNQTAFVFDRGASDNEDLYVVTVIRSATTFTATNDLTFEIGYIFT